MVIAKHIQTASSVFGLTDSVTHRMYSIANLPSCAYDANLDESYGIRAISRCSHCGRDNGDTSHLKPKNVIQDFRHKLDGCPIVGGPSCLICGLETIELIVQLLTLIPHNFRDLFGLWRGSVRRPGTMYTLGRVT